MPRERSRSSASVSLAFSWAAPASARVRSSPGLLQALLDLAQGHGQRGQPDLGSVVQVTLDPAQPGGRLVDRAGPLFLQFAGALGGGGDPRLRIPLGLQPGGALLKRRVVDAPVPVGHGVAEHPGGQAQAAEPRRRTEQRADGMWSVGR